MRELSKRFVFAAVLACALGLCAAVPAFAAESQPKTVADFSDTQPGKWYADDVDYVLAQGIMNGYDNGTFGPYDELTRGQVVTILWNLSGKPQVESAAPFSDVNYGLYYGGAIDWARQTGVVNGYADGTFRPNVKVTREQLIAMCANYAGTQGVGTESDGAAAQTYWDYAQTSAWFKGVVAWGVDAGIIGRATGYDYLFPKHVATRAETAQIVAHLHRDVLVPHYERGVLSALQAQLDDRGLTERGWRVELLDGVGQFERGYYVYDPLSKAHAELKGAFATSEATRASCDNIAELMNGMTASAREFAVSHEVDLPVYGIAYSTDGVTVFVSRDGATQLSFDIAFVM